MSGRYDPMPNPSSFPNYIEGGYEGMLVVRSELTSLCSHHHQTVTTWDTRHPPRNQTPTTQDSRHRPQSRPLSTQDTHRPPQIHTMTTRGTRRLPTRDTRRPPQIHTMTTRGTHHPPQSRAIVPLPAHTCTTVPTSMYTVKLSNSICMLVVASSGSGSQHHLASTQLTYSSKPTTSVLSAALMVLEPPWPFLWRQRAFLSMQTMWRRQTVRLQLQEVFC